MKKMLLTSTGLSNEKVKEAFIGLVGLNKKAVAIITTASEEKEKNEYCQLAFKQLKEIGFGIVDFIDLEASSNTNFSKHNVIYVSGGSTFRLLKFAKQANFKQTVQNLFDREGIYIGVSAGSYIMAPTIEVSTWKHGDKNTYGFEDLTALNFVPFLLVVHYKEEYKEALQQGIKHQVRILTDQQALLVEGDSVKFIGEGKEVNIS